MFHVQKSHTGLSDRVGSTVAFALLIGSWCAAYTIVMPAEPVRHQLIAGSPYRWVSASAGSQVAVSSHEIGFPIDKTH